MGTPIINLPQTGMLSRATLLFSMDFFLTILPAVLGLHAIKDKPVVVNGKIEIRPVCAFAILSILSFLPLSICLAC